MALDSKKPLRVWERNGEIYVYTNRWIKIETPEETKGVKMSKKTAKTKKK
jgi:hypothetical protein